MTAAAEPEAMRYDNELIGRDDRVRRYTSPEKLREIEHRTGESIRFYARRPKDEISQRIRALDEEWSMERWLETNASVLAFTGVMLGMTVNRKWLALSLVVTGFLFQHAVQGWCPPVPVLRRLGVRTRSEIDREKFALKWLRGDFKAIPEVDSANADWILTAVIA
ncbi:MAG TPA: hypothetical protein VFZ59_11290 [Verrucomicrobiae bacterium]|nr:hypothetical protein [Verrucomicrobiae bacterium]